MYARGSSTFTQISFIFHKHTEREQKEQLAYGVFGIIRKLKKKIKKKLNLSSHPTREVIYLDLVPPFYLGFLRMAFNYV